MRWMKINVDWISAALCVTDCDNLYISCRVERKKLKNVDIYLYEMIMHYSLLLNRKIKSSAVAGVCGMCKA